MRFTSRIDSSAGTLAAIEPRANRLISSRILAFGLMMLAVATASATDLLLVTDTSAQVIYKVDPTTGAKTVATTTTNNPWGIASDSAGNVYVAMQSEGGYVLKYDSNFTNSSVIVPGLVTPYDVTINPQGQLGVSDGQTVYKHNATTGAPIGSPVQVGTPLPGAVRGIVYDSSGNLYASNNSIPTNGGIYKFDSSGTQITSFYTNIGALMNANNVFISGNSLYYTQLANLVKTDLNGVKDTSFGTNGTVALTTAGWGITGIGNTLYVGLGGTNIGTFNATTGALINGSFVTGLSQSFYLTTFTAPVPEPSTYALGAIASGVLAWAARRRKHKATA